MTHPPIDAAADQARSGARWSAPIALALALGMSVVPGTARADLTPGFYVGGAIGLSLLATQSTTLDLLMGVSPAASVPVQKVGFAPGVALSGAVGWAVGNGLRFEIEANYGDNGQSHQSGSESRFGVFTNILFDIDLGEDWVTPYLGVGIGAEFAQWSSVVVNGTGAGSGPVSASLRGTTGNFAYQIIAGAAFPVAAVTGLSVTAEYRFSQLTGSRGYGGAALSAGVPATGHARASGDTAQSLLVGLRYAFDAVAPEDDLSSLPPPAPQQLPAARTYIVYFDAGSAALNPQAQDIVANAARASNRVAYTRVEISGHTDKAGKTEDSVELSKARSDAVAAEMVRWGILRSMIDIHAFGDEKPAARADKTAPEPRNRRVEIVYR